MPRNIYAQRILLSFLTLSLMLKAPISKTSSTTLTNVPPMMRATIRSNFTAKRVLIPTDKFKECLDPSKDTRRLGMIYPEFFTTDLDAQSIQKPAGKDIDTCASSVSSTSIVIKTQ